MVPEVQRDPEIGVVAHGALAVEGETCESFLLAPKNTYINDSSSPTHSTVHS